MNEQLLQSIYNAFKFEGIAAEEVALVVHQDYLDCMSPKQHCASRTRSLRDRLRRLLRDKDVRMVQCQLHQGGQSTIMHAVRIQ